MPIATGAMNMRAFISLLGIGLALAGCRVALPAGDGAEDGSGASGVNVSGFPKTGMYDVIREHGDDVKESSMYIDASNPQAFEHLVAPKDSNCSEREVSIENGQFSVRMVCDTGDGDITGIPMEAYGTYSENSIEMTSQTSLYGTDIVETATYRLRES
jgi:hypothetical protein